MKKIALLVDFTGVCQIAMEHTAIIARQSLSQVVLLHIAAPGREAEDKSIKNEIREFSKILENEGIPYAIQIDYGDFFEIIGKSIARLNLDLIIIGTHGIKGVKQNFVGSNVIRLVRYLEIPALVVQGHSQTPQEGYLDILIPMLGKEGDEIIKPVSDFASVFKSKIHFLGYYNSENKDAVTSHSKAFAGKFSDLGFETISEQDESSVYTSSYSKSIIQYADIEDVQLIVIIIHETGEASYFNDEDLENIMLNRLGKAILCL